MNYAEIRKAVESDPHLSRLVAEAKKRNARPENRYKVLSDKFLKINTDNVVKILSGKAMTRKEIAEAIDKSPENAYHILSNIMHAGDIKRTKIGATYYYHLPDYEVIE